MNEKMALHWRRFQGWAMSNYMFLVTRTARWYIEGHERVQEARDSRRPILWTAWHGQMMGLMAYGLRYATHVDSGAVVVGDERHDVLGAMNRNYGVKNFFVDMEGNPMAAGRVVLQVIREMKQGREIVIAPDGPDGPAYLQKEGTNFLARKARAAIIPCGIWTRAAYHLNRWDHYMIPYPFARFYMSVGELIMVERKADEATLKQTITQRLHETRARAQVMAGIRPWR